MSWGGSTPPSEQVAESQLVMALVCPWFASSEQVTAWEMIPRRISEQSCSIWELVRDSRGSPRDLAGGPVLSSREGGVTGAIFLALI